METQINEMVVNGVEYVRKDSVSATSIPKGNRVVVVVNHGWIYAGNVSEANGRIILTNAVWLFNWSKVGFAEVLKNPKNKNVDIRKIDYPVDIPPHSEVYRIPVPEDWGL